MNKSSALHQWALLCIVVFVFATDASGGESDTFRVQGGVECGKLRENGSQYCGMGISVKGPISVEMYDAVSRLFDEYNAARAERTGATWSSTGFKIDSSGGNLVVAIMLGQLLRDHEFLVIVERDATCASSCVFVLAGGSRRWIQGVVGIHRPYFMSDSNLGGRSEVRSAYQNILDISRRFLVEMNVSETLLTDMLRVPPEEMRFLTKGDFLEYGLVEEDPGWREMVDLDEAQSFGLSRQEFAKRKRISQERCSHLLNERPFANVTGWRDCYDGIMMDE